VISSNTTIVLNINFLKFGMKVGLGSIRLNPYNTREDFGDLGGLIASVKKFGLTQPLLVRKSNGSYELAFGGRRYEALKSIGHKEVDVEVRQITDEDMAMLALCENVHRKDLSPVELARAYQVGLKATKLSIGEFAKIVGDSDVKIGAYLKILNLPDKILKRQDKYDTTQLISLGRINGISSRLRVVLENILGEREINTRFLKEIVRSCEAIFAANVPHKRKFMIAGEVISQDYSHLPPENYRDISAFADTLLEREIIRYSRELQRTEKARKKLKIGKGKMSVRKVQDISNPNRELDLVAGSLRKADTDVRRAIRKQYYINAAEASQRKFRTVVNNLVSDLEKILNDKDKSRK